MNEARADADAFRCALAREVGLRFDDDKLPLLAEILASRVRETGSGTASAYLSKLATWPEEIGEVARVLTVSETYFMRNRDQFLALQRILRAREALPGRSLRMLSAGCASGEEAYSLAIAVLETLTDPREWTISILGVDVCPEAIARARAGSYSTWSLRDTPASIAQKYFHTRRGCHVIDDDVRAMVRFERHNLARGCSGFAGNEGFDIVFCRNVLMYFTPEAARELVADIARALAPGGHLFLGHAESLRGMSDGFALRQCHGGFYYERIPAPSPVVVDAAPAAEPWADTIGRASERIARLADDVQMPALDAMQAGRRDLGPVLELLQRERFEEALRLLSIESVGDRQAMLLRAVLLVGTGDIEAAERICEALLGDDDLDAGAHYVLALCREHAGDLSRALEHGRAAAYLDGCFAMPHLQLARIARRSKDLETTRRELDVALRLLPSEDAERIMLFGGGFGREGLVQLCRAELRACEGDR